FARSLRSLWYARSARFCRVPASASSTKASPAYARVNSASVQKAEGRTKVSEANVPKGEARTPSPATGVASGHEGATGEGLVGHGGDRAHVVDVVHPERQQAGGGHRGAAQDEDVDGPAAEEAFDEEAQDGGGQDLGDDDEEVEDAHVRPHPRGRQRAGEH